MSEMEQLKADLQALQRTHELLPVNGDIVKATLGTLTDMIQAKIKELEAPPDPFRYAKEVVKTIRASSKVRDEIGSYCVSLEDEIACLKEQLESRPVVWCLKSKYNNIKLKDWNGTTFLFESHEAAQSSRKGNNYNNFEPAIYTGKESE